MSISTSVTHDPPASLEFHPHLNARLFWNFLKPLSSILVVDLPEGEPASSSEPIFAPLFDASNTCIHPLGSLPATSPPVASFRAVYGVIYHYEDLDRSLQPAPCFIQAKEGEDFVTVEHFIREFDAYLRSPEVESASETCAWEPEMVVFFAGGPSEAKVYYSDTDSEDDEDEREERRREIREEKERFEGVKMLVVDYEPGMADDGSIVDAEDRKLYSLEELEAKFKNMLADSYRQLVVDKERGEAGEN